MPILIKTRAEIEKMRASGRILRQVHNTLAPLVVAGATTMDLENAAVAKIAPTMARDQIIVINLSGRGEQRLM